MEHLDLVLVGAFLLALGLVSRRLERTPLTAPILAVGFGILLGPSVAGVLHFGAGQEGEVVKVLAEFTLAFLLFHDAARIDLRLLGKNLGTPERLLTVGLLGAVLVGALVGWLLLDGLSLWEVFLVAAMLAPTDAALGQAVVTQEAVPMRVRQALNVESGLNDGLVVPVVAVMTMCAESAGSVGPGGWLEHVWQAAGYGGGVGLAIGLAAAKLLDAAEGAGWTAPGPGRAAVAAVPVIAFFGAEAVHGSGFLAAFVAGLTVGSTTRRTPRHAFELTEDAGETLGVLTWIAFGVAAVPYAVGCFGVGTIVYALLSLTVVRMLPVALSLLGSGLRLDTVLFIGWFGPRGLASVVFAFAVLHDAAVPGAEQIFGIATWTVLLSVLLHGVTAGALARRFGRRCEERDGGERQAVDAEVPAFPLRRAGSR